MLEYLLESNRESLLGDWLTNSKRKHGSAVCPCITRHLHFSTLENERWKQRGGLCVGETCRLTADRVGDGVGASQTAKHLGRPKETAKYR